MTRISPNGVTPSKRAPLRKPDFALTDPDTRVWVGDCRDILPKVAEVANHEVDLVFADPPFNWNRKYDEWDDRMKREDYLDFTAAWLDLCIDALTDRGAIWVNIPDDTCAEIVMHLKGRGLHMINWCIWHYRFGQNRLGGFINSKVHALYFAKDRENRIWNAEPILEPSDRATTYFDPRTHAKKAGTNGLRVPMDVWYGKFWGRIQGNNKERRANHDNQIPEVYLERVIRACSNEGDLVLDPFLGSGTTGLIARELDRRFIGTEYSKANATSAFQRIKEGPVRVKKDEPTQHITAIFAPRNRRVQPGDDA
jgi:site-specific DNA-methyltransferase (adenine-specific)